MSKDVKESFQVLNTEDLLKPSLDQSYKEIIVQDQEQNKTRARELVILPEKARQDIVEASQYSSYFPNPITKPFMRKYILAKLEFPTKGSELAQSLTELNVRIENLFNDAYTFKKAQLEADKIDVEVRQLERKQDKLLKRLEQIENAKNNETTVFISSHDDKDFEELTMEAELLDIEIEMKRTEQQNKLVSLNKIKLASMARYNEAMGWKGCVEDIMQEMNIQSIDDVNFDNIRMEEMAAKIKRWGELHAQGALELTPSKFQAIDSNQEAFVQGVQTGQQQLLVHQQRQEEARKQLEEAQRILGIKPGQK